MSKLSNKPSRARAREQRSFSPPLPIGFAPRKRANGVHGKQVPASLIHTACKQSAGLRWRAVEFIRAHGFPNYATRSLNERIAANPEFRDALDHAAQRVVSAARDRLAEAVERGEEWAVRQVLNSPLAREIMLGNDNRPQVAVAVGAAVLDPVDTAQRLARLDAALQRLAPPARRVVEIDARGDSTT